MTKAARISKGGDMDRTAGQELLTVIKGLRTADLVGPAHDPSMAASQQEEGASTAVAPPAGTGEPAT